MKRSEHVALSLAVPQFHQPQADFGGLSPIFTPGLPKPLLPQNAKSEEQLWCTINSPLRKQ